MKIIEARNFNELVEKQGQILNEGYVYQDVIGKCISFWKGTQEVRIKCLFWR